LSCISSVKGSSNIWGGNSSYGFTCISNMLHMTDTPCNNTCTIEYFKCKQKQRTITNGLKEIWKHIR
jgi:hypothetical protein